MSISAGSRGVGVSMARAAGSDGGTTGIPSPGMTGTVPGGAAMGPSSMPRPPVSTGGVPAQALTITSGGDGRSGIS